MITLNHDRQITITVGDSRKSVHWKPQETTVSGLYERLSEPRRGTETLAEYLAMSKADQDALKDVGGFVGGRLNGPRRKADAVLDRCIAMLDTDTIPPYGTDKILETLDRMGYGCFVYSTRKHRPEGPRLRIGFPFDRDVTPDEYDAVSRRLAADIGITMMDPTTFEPSRLMYWPSCCADGKYVFKYWDRPFVSVDKVLASYTNWRDWTERPQVPGANNYQKLAVQQGDPEEKTGVIGMFCREYSIVEAMETFLPGIYAPVDTDPNRYTYLNGSTTGGAIIYDNGKFLFSHHATDPCGNRLVNAFDMVRLHKYGHLDADMAPDTPTNRLPSFKHMTELASSDQKVLLRLDRERIEAGKKEFEGVLDSAENIPDAWRLTLERNSSNGSILPTIDNVVRILDNDPELKGRFALNEFAGRGEVLGPLPWQTKNSRRLWSDTDSNGLYWYLEKFYNITKRQNIDSALDIHAAAHQFNDVQDYLNGLVWDEVPRLDTLFIDFLGADDNIYTRAVCRKGFTAAVARAMEPGCKFDNMVILAGAQGLGKSTLLDKMSRGWFNDSIRTFEGKDASELLPGVWLVEVAELDAFRRTDVARIKQFLSLRADRYRAAYGRHMKEFPRRCVFFGTSNQFEFLQDTTGNRRFWPVDVGLHETRVNVWHDLTDEYVNQVWAEAKARWRVGEQLYLTGEVEQYAKRIQEQHRDADPNETLIRDFASKQIPVDWQKWDINRRLDFWGGGIVSEIKLTDRDVICPLEVWVELFHESKMKFPSTDRKMIRDALEHTSEWQRAEKPMHCGYYYGTQRCFIRKRKI